MVTINKYELLKTEGTWNETLQYVLSLSDKTEIEKHLKQSSSYEDLRMLVFLSKSTKNDKNLFQIFQTDSLPLKQRAIAGKSWLKIQNDEKQIHDFIIQMINNQHIPRSLKNQILENLHQIDCLKKSSSSFFDNLACHLTDSYHHHQFNLDAHLLPFCSQDQILNLLSQWSIKHFEQITSRLRSNLIKYQPLIVLHLMQCDLNERKLNNEKFSKYFQENNRLLSLLAKKEAKAVCRLTIEYINQLEPHQRFLPDFIQVKQKYFFKQIPDQMIELITIVASNRPGTIKYQICWSNEGYDLDGFLFPRSFSLDHYIRLFFALYDTCQWSLNHTIRIFHYMLQSRHQHRGLSSLRKQRKWLVDIVIDKHIGRDIFIDKLLKEGNEMTLKLFEEYTELTTPLVLHFISQHETISPKQRLSFIRYQFMTEEIFNQFVILSTQRERNYILVLQCAFSTNEEQVNKVLQWIAKRLTNERIIIIENFLDSLTEYNDRFQLEILPKNFETIDAIIQLAINHRQQSTNTLQTIFNYGLLLLQRVEHHRNIEIRVKIQTFAYQILKQCFSKTNGLKLHIQSLSESYPKARHLLADLLITDIFPQFLSKSLFNELSNSIHSSFQKPWRLPSIDSFLLDYLSSSSKLQYTFHQSSIISLFLKNRSTQIERVDYLINKIDQSFLLNETVQRIVLRSSQHRQLIEYDNYVNFPGLFINILNTSSNYLTGKQQENLTKMILNDYFQDTEITNLMKLKALRILPCLIHTYDQSLQWLNEKQTSSQSFIEPLDHIIICLPVKFDLTTEQLIQQFQVLATKLNAANAKYISDTMLVISRRIPNEIFLRSYLQLVQNEQFQKLGITTNKEILRLLTEFSSDSSLIQSVIKPLWDTRPHQDVRACLILTLLYFLDKIHSNDEELIVWKIFEEAADDPYLPVIQSLFADYRGSSRWPLTRLINSSEKIFPRFVNCIQFKILDHPTSLEARLWAWSNIDHQYCDTQKLIEKSEQLCIRFDKDANTLWEHGFKQIISLEKQRTISIIETIIQKLMICREEIDWKANAIDNQHDLPVYHRLHRILTILICQIEQFDHEKQQSFRSLMSIILQFDKTFAFLIGKLLLKIARNREDLQSMLILFEENLSENDLERILIELAVVIAKASSCSFIQKLNVEEKLQLAQWFIDEKDRGLFVFVLLKNHVFNGPNIHREQCQNLLRQLRQSENLCLRQQALDYTVRWKTKKQRHQRQHIRTNARNGSADPDASSIDLFDIFDAVQNE